MNFPFLPIASGWGGGISQKISWLGSEELWSVWRPFLTALNPSWTWVGKDSSALTCFSWMLVFFPTLCWNENQTFKTALWMGNIPEYQFLFSTPPSFGLIMFLHSLEMTLEFNTTSQKTWLLCFLASEKWHFYCEQGYSQILEVVLRRHTDSDNWSPLAYTIPLINSSHAYRPVSHESRLSLTGFRSIKAGQVFSWCTFSSFSWALHQLTRCLLKTTQTFSATYIADLSFPLAFWLNLYLQDASRLY